MQIQCCKLVHDYAKRCLNSLDLLDKLKNISCRGNPRNDPFYSLLPLSFPFSLPKPLQKPAKPSLSCYVIPWILLNNVFVLQRSFGAQQKSQQAPRTANPFRICILVVSEAESSSVTTWSGRQGETGFSRTRLSDTWHLSHSRFRNPFYMDQSTV